MSSMSDLVLGRGGAIGSSCGFCGTAASTRTIATTASSIQRGRVILSSRRRRACRRLDIPRACEESDSGKPSGSAVQTLEERARSDVAILAQGILRLDMRARQDMALIGSSFLKLDARAREDTEKLDIQAREKVKRLRRIAVADLRLADLRARRRAMEDAFLSVQVVKRMQSSLVNILKLKESELRPDKQNGITTKDGLKRDASYSTGSVALDRLLDLEEAYSSMASFLLVQSDGIDCTDPDELELVVATLLDMDEVAGGSGATFLAECATSPDVATRRALADALADAPSLWALGNAGMGALQRLAKDRNPAVAAAATKAIEDFYLQWRVENLSTFLPQKLPRLDMSDPLDDCEDT